MMPVGANGDSEPALAPLPTMMAIRNSGMPHAAAVAIAIGATSAAVAMLPGPIEASAAAEEEEHDRDHAAVAAADSHRVMREPVERAVALRQREEQRHAGERQEQLARKAAHHRVDRHAADVDADDPGQGDRQHADVERGDAADDDGQRQGGD